jgi:16S rRNA (cytidine1402-2'-O)-methyltransferase
MPLYLVATPIGNLKDITLRALEVLKEADLIACEDTRVSGKLLAHYGIRRPLLSYNDHNAPKQRPQLLAALGESKAVVLISDAGTPLISDPGYKLVREAAQAGHAVIPIPGPCAAIAAIGASGLPTDRFLFAGFLPPKAGERAELLASLAGVEASLVFYESAQRLEETLTALAEALGERDACIARELTKLHEEIRRDTLSALAAHYRQEGAPKGEIVIVVAPPPEQPAPNADTLDAALREALASLSVKDAAAFVAEQLRLPRKTVYARALALKGAP